MQEQVHPLVNGELLAGLEVAIKVKVGELDRLEGRQDPRTGVLVLGEFILEIGYAPHAADQELGMLLDGARVDKNLLDSQIRKLGFVDILLVVQINTDLVDDLVAPFFLDVRSDQACLVTVHVMLAQDLPDRFDAGLNGRLVVGGAILAQQVFEDVGGNDGIALDGLDEILADDKTGEMGVDFLVQGSHQ